MSDDLRTRRELRLATRGFVEATTWDDEGYERLLQEGALPVIELALALLDEGRRQDADAVLVHAVHDGIPASVIIEAACITGAVSATEPP